MSSTDGATAVSESDVALEDFNCTTCLWADDNRLVGESVTPARLRTRVNPFLEKFVGGGLMVTTLYLESPNPSLVSGSPTPGANTEKLRVTGVDEGVRK